MDKMYTNKDGDQDQELGPALGRASRLQLVPLVITVGLHALGVRC